MGIYRKPEDDPRYYGKQNPRSIRIQQYPGGGLSTGGGGVIGGGAGSINAGDGVSKAGDTINVNVDNTTLEIVADVIQIKDSSITIEKLSDEAIRSGFNVVLSDIQVDQKVRVRAPFDFNITRVSILADQVGDLIIDIWKDTYANAPPDNSDSITASAQPTLSNEQKSEDDTLTGWSTQISTGDWLIFNVDSVTDVTEATISIECDRT